MATVTSKSTVNLSEAQRRVRHPLERVRGTIRLYVGLESAALLVILVALWFWVDLIFDYGLFRTLGFDWVQSVARPVRAVFLGVLFVCVLLIVQMLFFNLLGQELRGLLNQQLVSRAKGQRLSPLAEVLFVLVTCLVTGAIAWDAQAENGLELVSGLIILAVMAVSGTLIFLAGRTGHLTLALTLVAALAYLAPGAWPEPWPCRPDLS